MKSEEINLKLLDELITEAKAEKKELIPILQKAQKLYGYLPKKVLDSIAKRFSISRGYVYGVATFYSFLSTKPLGEHVIMVCKGIPCWMKNSEVIIKTVEQELDVKAGETSKDGKFSLMLTNCIGACDHSPAMMIDGKVYDNLTSEKVLDLLHKLRR